MYYVVSSETQPSKHSELRHAFAAMQRLQAYWRRSGRAVVVRVLDRYGRLPRLSEARP